MLIVQLEKKVYSVPKSNSIYSQGERWFLLYQYFITHADRGSITPKEIRDYYLSKNIEVHTNTIYADISAIQGEVFGLQIDFDKRLNGGAGAYVLKNPPFTSDDLRLLADSVQASKFITQKKADELTGKINRLGSLRISGKATVVDRIRSMNESIVKDTGKIYQAIKDDKKITYKFFHYDREKQKVYPSKKNIYIVSPFATLWLNGYYYLYAYVDGENKFRFFRFDRMENVRVLGEKREGKEKYKSSDIASPDIKIFSMKPSTPRDITIKFANGLVDAVIDQFGKDVMMIPQDKDCFTITAKIKPTGEFYGWLFSFGRGAEIIKPEDIRENMRGYAKNVLEMYKDEEKV